jgi:hypothetical protein
VVGVTAALMLMLSSSAGANICGQVAKPPIEHVLNLPHVEVVHSVLPEGLPYLSHCDLQFYSGSRPKTSAQGKKKFANGSLALFGILKETKLEPEGPEGPSDY